MIWCIFTSIPIIPFFEGQSFAKHSWLVKDPGAGLTNFWKLDWAHLHSSNSSRTWFVKTMCFCALTRLDLSDSSIVCQLFQKYVFHRSPWKKEQQKPQNDGRPPNALIFTPSGTDGNVPTFGPFHQAWRRYNASNPPRCNDDKPSTYRCRLMVDTLLGTNISHPKALLKMMFLFPRWDMLVPWKVVEKVIDPKWCVAITLHGEEKWFTSSQCKSQHNSRGFFY